MIVRRLFRTRVCWGAHCCCSSFKVESHIEREIFTADRSENGVSGVSNTNHHPSGTPLMDRHSPSSSSNYDSRSSSALLSGPASDFSGYIRTFESAICLHNQGPGIIAQGNQIVPVARGFEQTVGLEMDMYRFLDDNVRLSEAVAQFLLAPTILVLYLWNERKYIKLWPNQRKIFLKIQRAHLQSVSCALRSFMTVKLWSLVW
jgi:hypothetical protein